MAKKIFTPISSVGEFGLIDKVTNDIKPKHKSTIVGIGDDSAVLSQGNEEGRLITSDMLVENVHFDPTYTPLKHLGYKSIVVNVSDICSMNGVATHAIVCLGIPNKYSVEHITELYSGIKMACRNYNIDLVGGDTTSSSTGLIINITIIGEAQTNDITYRGGAKPNDIVFVSGDLGAAYLGLQILEREKQIFNKSDSQPELENYQYLLQRQLKPEARVDVVELLSKINVIPTSMIDISDGLSSDLIHICNASKIGFRLFEEQLPISPEARATCEELRISPAVCALHGGEDYELLFTVSPKEYKKIEKQNEIKAIGHMVEDRSFELVREDKSVIDLKSEGWDSFLSSKKHI
ncbi:MAG: thiamine-phosphate kinase [Flavobacteriales bacterium]|nr:thiamine-phosphate kinase [Flavobacteriales bacterium]|tara:strand:- start:26048 stop:27097 length:1050 start_codon:yes stop_codon:yes gene_type:complete